MHLQKSPMKSLDKISLLTVFQCNQCGKAFNRLAYLKRHMIVHEEPELIRKFKCNQSGKAFKKRYHLTEDLRLYCAKCGKHFSDFSNLAKHKLTKDCSNNSAKEDIIEKSCISTRPAKGLIDDVVKANSLTESVSNGTPIEADVSNLPTTVQEFSASQCSPSFLALKETQFLPLQYVCKKSDEMIKVFIKQLDPRKSAAKNEKEILTAIDNYLANSQNMVEEFPGDIRITYKRKFSSNEQHNSGKTKAAAFQHQQPQKQSPTETAACLQQQHQKHQKQQQHQQQQYQKHQKQQQHQQHQQHQQNQHQKQQQHQHQHQQQPQQHHQQQQQYQQHQQQQKHQENQQQQYSTETEATAFQQQQHQQPQKQNPTETAVCQQQQYQHQQNQHQQNQHQQNQQHQKQQQQQHLTETGATMAAFQQQRYLYFQSQQDLEKQLQALHKPIADLINWHPGPITTPPIRLFDPPLLENGENMNLQQMHLWYGQFYHLAAKERARNLSNNITKMELD